MKAVKGISEKELHAPYDSFMSVRRKAQKQIDRVYRMMASKKKPKESR